MPVSEDLRARVERLSPHRRQQLFERATGTAIGGGVTRIVAYVAARKDQDPPDAASLREYLRQRLPGHMVPSAIVVLDTRLPRLPNGKLDLDALPDPGPLQSSATFVEPRTESERVLARIWCDVLGVDLVGVHDNFFELGGDSILSIRVIARAQQAGLAIAPDQLFRHQTLAALAAAARPAAANEALAGPATRAADTARDAQFPDAGLTSAELDRFLGTILP